MGSHQPGASYLVSGICTVCGLSHVDGDRLGRLRRALPLTLEQCRERWPCLYDGATRSSAERLLFRDLRRVHAIPRRRGEVDTEYDLRRSR